MNKKLADLPEISFIDNIEIDDWEDEIFRKYEEIYEEITNTSCTLNKSSIAGILVSTFALISYQMLKKIDYAGKMNLLKYSNGGFLDNITARTGFKRIQGACATCIIRFFIAEPQDKAVQIPHGTRVSTADQIYFATNDYAEIKPGEIFVDAESTCTEEGVEGSNIPPGRINLIVDPFPYASEAHNITMSYGGKDKETDDEFAERVFISVPGLSATGTESGYTAIAKEYDTDICDVKIKNIEPYIIDIYVLLSGGIIPDQDYINAMQMMMNKHPKKAMVDKIVCHSPDIIEVSGKVTYFINKSDEQRAVEIKDLATQSVSDYICWQKARIARDVNPDYLRCKMITAGAKRIHLEGIEYRKIEDTQVASVNLEIIYGGIEDD